jgi:PAS domain S-box-containing protein
MMNRTNKILVIDDDEEMRNVLTHFLKRKGYEVHLAKDAYEAFEQVEGSHYDLLLVDIMMPHLTGLELLRALKENSKLEDFIIVTGSDSNNHREEARLLGTKGYFAKPFDPEELLSLIASVLEKKGTERTEPRNLQAEIVRLGGLGLNHRNLDLYVHEVMRSILSALNLQLCGVFQLLPDGGTLVLNWGTGWQDGFVGKQVPIEKTTPEGHTLREEKAISVPDFRDEKTWRRLQLVEEHEIVSCTTVVVHNTGTPFGVLGVYSKQQRKFNSTEIHFLQSISNILSHVLERTEVEEALELSEEKYSHLFEESRDVIFVSTPAGELIDINPSGVRLFGYTSKEEMLQVNIEEDLYLHREDRKHFHRMMADAGFVKEFEQTLQTKSGEIVYVQETSTALHNERGDVVAYRGTLRDITRIRQLQEQLLEAHKMKTVGLFASSVAHDFNNLLAAISASCDLIRNSAGQPELLQSHITELEGMIDKGSSLTKRLLAFARKQAALQREVDLNEILKGLSSLLQRIVGDKIKMILQLSPKSWLFRGDGAQMEQVVMNLCINARDAMPLGGKLTIGTENAEIGDGYSEWGVPIIPGQYVMMTVADTGYGIEPSIQARIFEPFFTTKDQGAGTGLGLCSAYMIVKQARGYIFVHSKPGQGAIFTVYLPRLNAEQ